MGIENLVVKFGAAGSPQTIVIAEQVYASMPVGHAAVTQDRWRANTVTVNGIDFKIFPGIDSDGRADVWIYASYGEAAAPNTSSNINRQYANVDLQITLNGVAQNLFGQGATYNYDHQRSCWMRWQSSVMPWQATPAFIKARIADGTFLAHHSSTDYGQVLDDYTTALPTTASYLPFKDFCGDNQSANIGDGPRSSPGGGERTSIGPAHEWFARMIAELAKDNTAWLTATRLQVLQYLAETAAQFPHASGFLEPVTNRLLDPSVKPHCSHSNPAAWYGATGIPQPGVDGADPKRNGSYDTAHPYNKFSFQAYHLTKDPFHLLLTQGAAICAIAYCMLYGNGRGVDGKTLRIGFEEQERSYAWSLQALFQAWNATPATLTAKPFRDKAWFNTALSNTLQFLMDTFALPVNTAPTAEKGAMRFWRNLSGADFGSYYGNTRFMEDYGNIVIMQGILLGYSGARTFAEWRLANIKQRFEMGGNWFLNDQKHTDNTGQLAYLYAPKTGSLPYTDTAGFKAWYPTVNHRYTSASTLTPEQWNNVNGRDLALALSALNIATEAASRGLITPGFDIGAMQAEVRSRLVPPYTLSGGGALGFVSNAKQYFNYAGAVAAIAPPDNYVSTTGQPLYFGRTAP